MEIQGGPCPPVTEIRACQVSETWSAGSSLFLKIELKLPFLNGLEFSYFFRSLKLDVSLKSFDVFYTKADV